MRFSRLLAPVLRNRVFYLLLIVFAGFATTWAQVEPSAWSGRLTGTVVDPLGAVVPNAAVTLYLQDGSTRDSLSNNEGLFSFSGLPPGSCTLSASASGFATSAPVKVTLRPGQSTTLRIPLSIEVQQQQVNVGDQEVSISADRNGGAIVMSGTALDALSNDSKGLQNELNLLSGGDAQSGTQFLIDGFSAGKLPPKSAIREIRINQNPYSAQYDSIGTGRVEVFTKPGADKLHGELNVMGNHSALNSRNPYVQQQPSYYDVFEDGDLTGPITKALSYFVDGQQQNVEAQSFVDAVTLTPGTFQPLPVIETVPGPASNTNIGPRLDFSVGKQQTLTIRYRYNTTATNNVLASQFQLPEQALTSNTTEQTFQFADTQTYGERLVNETRFQYMRDRNRQDPASTTPATEVQGSFTGGGNNLGNYTDNLDHYELQDYVSLAHGSHFFRFGGRYRAVRDSNRSTGGFNGLFIFPTLQSYQITEQGLAAGESFAQIQAAGGGASQFGITAGTPSLAILVQDAGLYAEDEWKFHSNMDLIYGLRYETQTGISDHADFAPRVGYSWGIGGTKTKPPEGVLRAGAGLFYQRFDSQYILNARRQNGLLEQQYIVPAPQFYPDIPPLSSLETASQQTSPTTYQISPRLHAPYAFQAGVGLQKDFFKRLSINATYLYTRGIDQLLSRNINAPLIGTFNPANPLSGARPLGNNSNLYQYQSEGAAKRNSLKVNWKLQTKPVLFYSEYVLGYANANTAGAASFPSNQYDLHVDYGRAADDIRNRFFFAGIINAPWKLQLLPFFVYQSALPFNIVLGQDLNGDTQYNDRPAFAHSGDTQVQQTVYGNFNLNPGPFEPRIPINYGTGPSTIMLNMELARSFSVGPRIGPPGPPAPGKKTEVERRYTLQFSVKTQNILNHVNPAPPVGVLGSPLFGQYTALADTIFSSTQANRIIYLNMNVSF